MVALFSARAPCIVMVTGMFSHRARHNANQFGFEWTMMVRQSRGVVHITLRQRRETEEITADLAGTLTLVGRRRGAKANKGPIGM